MGSKQHRGPHCPKYAQSLVHLPMLRPEQNYEHWSATGPIGDHKRYQWAVGAGWNCKRRAVGIAVSFPSWQYVGRKNGSTDKVWSCKGHFIELAVCFPWLNHAEIPIK